MGYAANGDVGFVDAALVAQLFRARPLRGRGKGVTAPPQAALRYGFACMGYNPGASTGLAYPERDIFLHRTSLICCADFADRGTPTAAGYFL